MKKILFIIAFTLIVIVPTITYADTPSCSTTENGIPANIGDPACYTSASTTSSWSTTEFDYYRCVWVDTGMNYCKKDDNSFAYATWASSCPSGWYLYWAPVVRNTCTGSVTCGNMNGTHVGDGWDAVYKTIQHSSTSTTYTCHYLIVEKWGECDPVYGTQSANDVDYKTIGITQAQASGTYCENLNDATTRDCGLCDSTLNGAGSGVAPGPVEDLCMWGFPNPEVPLLDLATNMWEWACEGTENTRHEDIIVASEIVSYKDYEECSAPRDEDGQCASNNPGAQGEYAWNATEFRGKLCAGGTPTISSDFNTALPMPLTEGNSATVTWGCNHIGIGVSTAADACSASRLAPKPGVCGPDDDGEFDKELDISQRCCNPNSYPSCTVDSTFAPLPITQSEKTWNWTCNGSKNNGTDAVNCEAECIPEIDVNVSPNPFPLTSDGVTVEVTVTKTGVCAGEYSCTVDNKALDGNNKVTFNDVDSPRDIVIACNGKTIDTIHIAGYCTQRECNAQGTCQATPKSASNLNDCSSTCNSNADCSSGRMIETRP